jgi:phage terminase large subunit-like protein
VATSTNSATEIAELIKSRKGWYLGDSIHGVQARPGPPRPQQVLPLGDWRFWLLLAGRGFGKTRVGAENVIDYACEHPGARIAVVGATSGDVRSICFEGDSGLLACLPSACANGYNRTLQELRLPNGTLITGYSAEKPGRLRGPQHEFAWADEIAQWQYGDTWDMLKLGLRHGDSRAIITTTPLPKKIIRELLADPKCHVTRGSTYDNRSNLSEGFFADIVKKYDGTRLGRQELHAEILDDVPGALWIRKWIEGARRKVAPDLARVVVAIDPAVTSGEDADETGIVVVAKGFDGRGYVLADRSCRISPDQWARRAIDAYKEFRADRIIAETNNGGDLVERVIRTVDPNVSYKSVHASRGKRTRAEPVAALYEQGRVSHVGEHAELEDQMVVFVPDQSEGSPDRVDALVWGLSELFLENKEVRLRVL